MQATSVQFVFIVQAKGMLIITINKQVSFVFFAIVYLCLSQIKETLYNYFNFSTEKHSKTSYQVS